MRSGGVPLLTVLRIQMCIRDRLLAVILTIVSGIEYVYKNRNVLYTDGNAKGENIK